ncbi:MAG: DUF4430 domain-containing protein [Candidatus Korarchaeum sp.]|nr:DUF4430 domain-containing protein [Candidatus Korarchaeum sp.]MDW8035970.1 DUF4430 domain-containing protein [Candidatus Korarchaeum sp.]
MSEKTLKVLVILLLIWALVATSLYLQQALKPQASEELLRVNIGIKYKNGTVEWHNSTAVSSGSTLLDATRKVAVVNHTEYPGMGSFVNSINGVKNEHPYYWMWWYWDKSMGWILGPIAADKYLLSDGEVVIWFYEDTSQYPPQKP